MTDKTTDTVAKESSYDDLAHTVWKMKENIVKFTMGLKTTFTAADASKLEDFKNLRGKVLADSLIYFQAVAPITKQTLLDVRSSFDLIGAMDTPLDFQNCLETLITDCQELSKKVNICTELHKETLTSATFNEIVAEKVAAKLILEDKRMKSLAEEKDKLKARAAENLGKTEWLGVLRYLPHPIFSFAADKIDHFVNDGHRREIDKYIKEGIADRSLAEVYALGSIQISHEIIPALKSFIENLELLVLILNRFMADLDDVSKRSENAREASDAKVKILFKVVKSKVTAITKNCMDLVGYFDVCEAQIIAFEGLQEAPNFIDQWLQEKLELKAEPKSLFERMKLIVVNNLGLLKNSQGVLTKVFQISKASSM